MKYDDLLNIPYKVHGRDRSGYDCYGLVMECCRRCGTPIADPVKDLEKLDANLVNDYINKGINIRRINSPEVGCIVEMSYGGNCHVGFLVARNLVIHCTTNHGVKTTPLGAVKVIDYFEVIDESNINKKPIEQKYNS